MSAASDIAKFVKDTQARIERPLTAQELMSLGDIVIDGIRDNCSKGISPIAGDRFPAYKNPERYPGKRKPQRPVNLFLSGAFLGSLRQAVKIGTEPFIRFFFSDPKSYKKEKGHREGAGGQPKRPIMPKGSESFSQGILVAVNNKLKDIVNKALASK